MLLRVGPLPEDALAAAAAFHGAVVPKVLGSGEAMVTLVFAPAGHEHAGWRLAAVQSLARALSPARVNALASADEAAITAAASYLQSAPGVTGQYLVLDGAGAGPVVNSDA